jgi:outer membrane immunogenic protein
MKKLVAVLAASAVLTPAAFAADFLMPVEPAPYVAPMTVSDWTGFYVGVFGGAAFNPATPGVIEIDEDLDGDFDEALAGPLLGAFGPNFNGANDAGALAGIEVGYDWQMDKFVVGGIIDIAYADYDDRQQAFSATPASYSADRDLDMLATVRVRGGYLVTDDLLAYVHGGLAVGDVGYSFNSTNPNGVSRGGADMDVGYQVGAGLEARVTENVSVGIEYAYTNLGGDDFTTRFDNGPFAAVNPEGADLRGTDDIFDFHTVKASVKYRF